MKRFRFILALAICLTAINFPISIANSATVVTKNWSTYVSDNNTGQVLTTDISTTTIRPNIDKILGFYIIGIETTETQELIATLYDGSGLTVYLGQIETIAKTMNGIWFPYPRKLATGLTIVQGAHTRVIVYYDPF